MIFFLFVCVCVFFFVHLLQETVLSKIGNVFGLGVGGEKTLKEVIDGHERLRPVCIGVLATNLDGDCACARDAVPVVAVGPACVGVPVRHATCDDHRTA